MKGRREGREACQEVAAGGRIAPPTRGLQEGGGLGWLRQHGGLAMLFGVAEAQQGQQQVKQPLDIQRSAGTSPSSPCGGGGCGWEEADSVSSAGFQAGGAEKHRWVGCTGHAHGSGVRPEEGGAVAAQGPATQPLTWHPHLDAARLATR